MAVAVRGCFLYLLVLLCIVDLCLSADNAKRTPEFCPFSVKSHLGCYADFDVNATFVPYNVNDPTISPVTADKCACKCGNLKYRYSALINLNECHCTNTIANISTTTGCINKCVDNKNDTCGGFDNGEVSVFSVYSTTAWCYPECNANQTCTLYDDAFYMCTPSCEFSANFVYEVPCSDYSLAYLNVTSATHHGSNFSYSLDGATRISAPYNVPIPFTFHTAVEYSFNIKNRFGCTVVKNITLPAATIPITNQAPTLTFDPASMSLEAKYYKLLYPSETGNVILKRYGIDYRYKCPNDNLYVTDWITVNNTDIEHETIDVHFEYALQYDVRVHSQNCVGESGISEIATSIAPDSPYIPTIVSATPQNEVPTTGGTIIITGLYLTDTPTVFLDGTVVTTLSKSATQASFQIGAGQGSHPITVLSSANHTCQRVLSSPFVWSYASPSVTGVSVLSNAGGALTITGTNFGLTSAPNVTATIDQIPCGSCSVTTDHTTITCNQCPPGSGLDHNLIVEVAGLASATFEFDYAICDPMCIFGECVGTNQCACEDGYGGKDCSEVHICAADAAKTAYLGNTCGACTDQSVCCQFTSTNANS